MLSGFIVYCGVMSEYQALTHSLYESRIGEQRGQGVLGFSFSRGVSRDGSRGWGFISKLAHASLCMNLVQDPQVTVKGGVWAQLL